MEHEILMTPLRSQPKQEASHKIESAWAFIGLDRQEVSEARSAALTTWRTFMPIMTLSSRVFPSRTEVPNTSMSTITVQPSGAINLDVPLQVRGPADDAYGFLFWHVIRQLEGTHAVSFPAPADESSFFATAWYQKLAAPCVGCPPVPPLVTTVAFSSDRDEVIADTPIAAVTPAGAWPGPPSTVVSMTSATPASITAKLLIEGSGEFVSWLAFGGLASGAVLTVPAQTSSLAIALFATPSPDPCALLRAQRDNLNPGDFRTPDEFRRALAAANARLHDCERAHGEPID